MFNNLSFIVHVKVEIMVIVYLIHQKVYYRYYNVYYVNFDCDCVLKFMLILLMVKLALTLKLECITIEIDINFNIYINQVFIFAIDDNFDHILYFVNFYCIISIICLDSCPLFQNLLLLNFLLFTNI